MDNGEIKVKKILVKNILSKTNLPVGDYAANPYVGCIHSCKYCYASFMKRFTGHLEPWGEFLDVKYWPEIKDVKKYEGKELFIGSVTDAYNPQEKIYKRTRTLLEQLQNSGVKITISTKSDLILRDLDLIKSFPNICVAWSINTLNETFQSDMDKAVSIKRRLDAMKIFHNSGICTTCFISPIFPEITDIPAIIERVKNNCNFIWLENLNLRGNYKKVILDYVAKYYPNLIKLYDEIYNKKSYQYWELLDEKMQKLSEKLGLLYLQNDNSVNYLFNKKPVMINYFYHEKIRKNKS